jgi:hypothetical protein
MKLIPIYTSGGDLGAFLVYPYIYNKQGEWIGWVAPDRKVFSVHGHYIGEMSQDPRILRVREWSGKLPKRQPPPEPPKIRPPAHVPLAPQMPEVPVNMIDVLEEAPELLPPVGFGDLIEDMD